MDRILIIGCCGSGKSTLARALYEKFGKKEGHELMHLDQHFFSANWEEPPTEVWRGRVKKLVAKPKWIMDGNYGGTFDLRIPRADTIIYMDHGTATCLWRVTKRVWKNYGKTRPDMQEGCKERFSWSFMHYVLMFRKLRRKKHMAQLDAVRDT